jgi:hypothetical protein
MALASSLLYGTTASSSAAVRGSKAAQPQGTQQTVPAEPNVIVSLCIASGNINVRGWERNEVQARSADAQAIELRRASASTTGPASRIEVMVADPADGPEARVGNCSAFSDIELNVPRGAIVQLQTRDGDINVSDVAEARVEAQSGDIDLNHVTRLVEARALSGDITLRDSSGRVQLGSVSGSVEATNVRSITPGDDFEAGTVSGDVILKGVGHAQVHAKSVSGSLNMDGSLARGGRYDFKTMSGDVLLNMPADSSFKVHAKVAQGGEIVSDFAITPTEETPQPGTVHAPKGSTPPATPQTPRPAPAPRPAPRPASSASASASAGGDQTPHASSNSRVLERLNGIFGTGDATLNLASFSGTVYLRRR